MKQNLMAAMIGAAFLSLPSLASAGGLRGSPSSMREQHAIAVERDLDFLGDAAEVRTLVEKGGLEFVESNADYTLVGVSFPYALPEVKMFLERIGQQYHEAHGRRLVVTSLTRPTENQPRNAHELSVHPAGMAVDFRVPQTGKERAWLESVLLQLENKGLLDVTRERYPPHYHVAVFPAAYAAYAAERPGSATFDSRGENTDGSISVGAITLVPAVEAIRIQKSGLSVGTSMFLIVAGMSAVAFGAIVARRRDLQRI